ncbi:hypothetical protein FOZ60_013422 [Perkinsus olseni]|uniref:Uncharacterized protein n=3 Tax=Perkinsus olseni TaxID=32597 RepID=A0A7J6P9C0_PEROL|nr:hypothetical protein FOZ60_013422 [Perkinsus olseni]
MSIRSVFFAAVLGSVVCQENIVRLLQRRVPFQNGNPRSIFITPSGTLRLIQTVELEDAVSMEYSQFGAFSSILVTPKGDEILGTDEEGLFMRMELKATYDDQFDVPEAIISPMRDPQGDRIVRGSGSSSSARGLAVDGTYRGGGRGALCVTYTEDKRMLKFPTGTNSPTSAEVDISHVLDECEYAPKAIDKMRPDPLLPAYLLMICDEPTTQGGSIYPAFGYDGEETPIRFEVESDGGFVPVDMGGLSDGSLMILFRGPDHTLRIGLVTSRDLSSAMRGRGGAVTPQIILEAAESDGFNVGRTSGLAVREDDGKVFVYIVDSGFPSVYLTAFEWVS